MKRLIEIIFVFFISAVIAEDETCQKADWGYKTCKKSNTITRVSTEDSLFNSYFTMQLPDDTIISENVFSAPKLQVLRIHLPYVNRENRSSASSLSLFRDSFTGLPNLTTLDIKNANINFNGANPFSPLESLTNLEISKGNFTEVPTKILESLPKLTKLSLRNNKISAIRAHDLAPLTHLEDLDLSWNEITHVEPGSFERLKALRVLSLSTNAFPAVSGIFKGLTLLKKLRISRCFDHNGFQSFVLQDVPNLDELQVAFNNITVFQPGMFNALSRLRELSLYGNEIREVPAGVFEQLRSLKEISLVENEIETITPGAFGTLNLDDLIISHNRPLKTILTDTFKGLTVRRMTLAKNGISELKPRAFNLLHVTNMIDLTENNINTVGTEDFSGLKTKDLDLSQNNLTAISPDAFKNTELQRLGLFGDSVMITDKAKVGLEESVVIMR